VGRNYESQSTELTLADFLYSPSIPNCKKNRNNLITSINEKCGGKVKQKQKEEGKLKVLRFQEHKQKLNEAHLQLTDYSNITYDSLDEAFIEEKKSVLPELTAGGQSIIDAALNSRPSNEVTVEAYGLSIKWHDILG